MAFGSTLFIIGLCVFSVFAVDTKLNPVSSRLQIAQVTVRNQMSNILSMAINGDNDNTECTKRLQETVDKIGNLSVVELNQCYSTAEEAYLNATSIENSNVVEVNNTANAIIQRLTYCGQLNATHNATNNDIFQCFVNDFDKDLAGLDEISSVSELAMMQIEKILASIQIEAFDCINLYTMEAKINMTRAYNDEIDCLKYGITTTSPKPETTTANWELPTVPNQNH